MANMSGKVCAFDKCSNSKRKNPELVFFSFPRWSNLKTDSRIAAWAKNAGLSDSSTPDFYRSQLVCQHHFENWCFTNVLRKRLVHNAVPTISTDDIKAKGLSKDNSLIDESKLSKNIAVENETVPQTRCYNAENNFDTQTNKPTDQFLKCSTNKLQIDTDNNLFINNKYIIRNYKTKPTNYKTYSRVKNTNYSNVKDADSSSHPVDENGIIDLTDSCLGDISEISNISIEALQQENNVIRAHLSTDMYDSSMKPPELEEVDQTIKENETYDNISPASSMFENSSTHKQSSEDDLECGGLKTRKINYTITLNTNKKYSTEGNNRHCSKIIRDIQKVHAIGDLTQSQKDNSVSDRNNDINDLKRKLNYYRRQSMMKSSVINNLKKALIKSRKSNIYDLIDKADVSNVRKTMAKMQINESLSWNLNEQTLALKLHSKFPVTTKYMRDILGLRFPDKELLCTWIENKNVMKYK